MPSPSDFPYSPPQLNQPDLVANEHIEELERYLLKVCAQLTAESPILKSVPGLRDWYLANGDTEECQKAQHREWLERERLCVAAVNDSRMKTRALATALWDQMSDKAK